MNTRTCYIGVLLFFITGSMFGQSPSLDSLKNLFSTSTNDSIRFKLSTEIAEAFSMIQVDSSLAWTKQGHEIAKSLDDKDLLGESLYQLGVATRNKQDFSMAMELFLEAIDLFKETGNEKLMIETEFEISVIYRQIGEYKKAKQHLDRFYQYYLEKEDAASIIFALSQYNILYELLNMPDSMLYYAKTTLATAEKYNQPKYMAKMHNNLAGTYLYLEDFEKAKFHFKEAIKIGFKEDNLGLYFNQYAQAQMYYDLAFLDSSLIYANKALETARAFGDLERESQLHKFLSDIYSKKNDFPSAFKEINTFIQLEDSMTVMRHEKNISELTIQYETQQKEAQIAQQQLELEREANRRNLILFLALGGLLIIGAVFFYLQNKQRMKQQQAELSLKLKASEAERLLELDQMKSNFFANISHEFRTPLSLILGPLREMFNDTFKGDSKAYQKMMIRNGERLLGLVNQLLDLSKLESGRMQLDMQAADLAKFVQSIVFSFESWAMRKRIFFDTNFPKQTMIAFFDSDKLEKIISNLLSNALKFTPEQGRISFTLSILDEKEDRIETEIRVKDTGIGISPEQLPHIFDRFYSQPREDQDMQGSGIGLALTKELVELYGGTIKVESELGKGALFTINMAFQLADKADMDIPTPTIIDDFLEEDTPEAFQRTNSKKPVLLIVEDNPDLREYIKDQFRDDYQLVEAVNGKQGLKFATEIIPDLVLTDVMMPEMNGMNLCNELKADERTSHIPVVMLTALSDQAEKISGLSMGADAYLIKPFDRQELQITVQNLVVQRKQLREKFSQEWTLKKRAIDFASPAEESFLKKVEEIVEANLENENFSIEYLGKTVGMSRSQLHRKIKAITNQSPSVFVRTLRLHHAYKLLEQKAGNISEIAFQVGIPNLAYFSRSFSDQFGFPPSDLLHA